MASKLCISTVDVLVVGAGLSGLQAATDIQAAGFSCIVLEAKDRVGGKTLSVSVDHGPGKLDVGAAWINDTAKYKMFNLYQKYGLEPIIQRTAGDEVFHMNKTAPSYRTLWPGLPPVEAEQRVLFEWITKDMEDDCQSVDINDSTANSHIEDVSLGEYFRRKGGPGSALGLWTAWIHDLTGVDPDEISLLYWLDYAKSCGGLESLLSDGPKGAQYMTNRGGNQTISQHLAADLKPGSVHLKLPVIKISQGDTVLVETLSGDTFHARKVLISVPTPLYRHIKFERPLPTDKQEYADSTQLGPYSKCILIYRNP